MSELPERWDPRKVALCGDKETPFLLRPGQILVGPGDAPDVAKVLTGWKPQERAHVRRDDSSCARRRTRRTRRKEVLEAIAQRAQGHRQPPAGPGARRAQPRARGRGAARSP